MNNIEVCCERVSLPYHGIDTDFLSSITEALLKHLSLSEVSVTVIMTDDAYIRTINRQYRKKDRATDVISFANRDDGMFPVVEEGPEELGDIFISLETARVQAREFDTTFRQEVKRLLIHGMLHLAGYDHERSPEDEQVMQQKEEELFELVPG